MEPMQSILERPAPEADVRLAYGKDPNQFGELRLPRLEGPYPAYIVIHGGFWRAAYDLKHIGHFCQALSMEGVATFSVEYRRIGQAGGGWPGTFNDVRAAAAFLAANATKYNIDAGKIGVTGHSAGGHLALWLGAEKPLALRGVVSLAGVADLRRAYELKLGKGVVGELLGGGPEKFPERYRMASPIERLPLKLPVRLVHGTEDQVVPLEIGKRYEAAARAVRDDARLIAAPGAGHFELIDPQAMQWRLVTAALRAVLL